MKIFLLTNPQGWERIPEILESLKAQAGNILLLIAGEAVNRCLRCDPQVFPSLRQFVLDGGRIYVCEESLRAYGIPPDRPPDFMLRVPDGLALVKELASQGWQVEEI